VFNTSPFGRTPFGRAASLEIALSVTFETLMEFEARINVEAPLSAVFESQTEMDVTLVRETALAADIETQTEMLAQMIRERMIGATIETQTEVLAKIVRAHVEEIRFTGNFPPGARIEIDTAEMTVTINGENAIHLMEGDFLELIRGVNTLTYSDSETQRSVLTRITHNDKYLY